MKLNKSFEQSICILLVLAMQKDHSPLSSQFISQKLDISQSYSKKTIRKLVEGDLLTSSTGNNGGLKLKKNLDEISLFDIYKCTEEAEIFESTNLPQKIFLIPEKVEEREAIIVSALEKIQENLFSQLDEIKLSTILEGTDYINGCVDWKELAAVKDEAMLDTFLKNFAENLH
ncbi:RrF2 family transcriptional regulator [Enterococcus hermanniensis]|uniref:Rrf2 family transcriptional regulator n=1 Tax=Enterococcus hermanniensis TaxID=249189 RepID=A0A1L8TQ03_9ENTE|nr:Rrf2 family transcriptional regulator [Enterococcus hermanniensis]OJG46154.1 Rrf2 family transcriptional regulator [Enterococcus hermanniensis]